MTGRQKGQHWNGGTMRKGRVLIGLMGAAATLGAELEAQTRDAEAVAAAEPGYRN